MRPANAKPPEDLLSPALEGIRSGAWSAESIAANDAIGLASIQGAVQGWLGEKYGEELSRIRGLLLFAAEKCGKARAIRLAFEGMKKAQDIDRDDLALYYGAALFDVLSDLEKSHDRQ